MSAPSFRTVEVRSHARSGAARLLHLLEQLRCTQIELSRRLAVDPRTVRAWVTGRARTPPAVLMLCDAWLADPALERRHAVAFRRTKL